MSTILTTLASHLLTWRTLALVLALLNLKNLPFMWHLKLFYILLTKVSKRPRNPTASEPGIPRLFRPISIFTHAPLMETDYNLHKSNSTYFSDLDHSRTSLGTTLLSPGFTSLTSSLLSESPPKTGALNIILGSVHASFRKEIRPYERYEVRSRVLGWDRKWLVMGTWFIRPARKGEKDAEGEVVLASALSKYVMKKGRFTVVPERALEAAGLLPERSKREAGVDGEGEVGEKKGETEEEEEGLTTVAAPEVLVKVSSVSSEGAANGHATGVKDDSEVVWDWDMFQQENKKGLKLAEGWLNLDRLLFVEKERVPGT